MECIADHLHIDGLESSINAGADELQVGVVIIRSHQYHKANMIVTDSDGVYFWGFVCSYNILTPIQHRMKGEENLEEVVKHKKYLAILNMFEDEVITVYTFSIVDPDQFGCKRSTR